MRNQINNLLLKVIKFVAPPPDLKISEWADNYRRLSSESSSEPGKWNTDRAPYQREILDIINDPLVEQVTIMSSAQVGKTELILNAIGYFAHFDPSPILAIQPTLEMAESFSKDRLSPMIRDCVELKNLFGGDGSKKGNNTLLHKKFKGGHITLAGSNSPASLASRPIRIVLFDECDRYPHSAGDEGDPMALAKKRTTTFYNKKIIAVSTPTIKNRSRIETEYLNGDQRKYYVSCPHCHKHINFIFKNLHWNEENPKDVSYRCQECDALIDEGEKIKLLLNGKWIAERPFEGHASFHLNELYSPWKRWSEIVSDFLIAKKSPITLRTFINTSLGETWEDKGEAPEWRRIYDKRESYQTNQVPMKGLFLTCSCDIQKDRIEAEVKAWGRNKENWSIDHRVFMGDTAKDEVWEKLKSLINEFFQHESGSHLPIRMTCIDSGFNTQKVYDFVRNYSSTKVVAIKGNQNQQTIISPPKAVDVTRDGNRVSRGLKVWSVGVNLIKSEIYSFLRMEKPTEDDLKLNNGNFPSGYYHFPEYGEEFFKQLTAESLVVRTHKGYQKSEWVKTYERNEALDLSVYNRAAAAIVGIDRFKESHWIELEENLEIKNENQPNEVIQKTKKVVVKKSDFWNR